MTTAARDLFPFVTFQARYTVADGTRYDEVSDSEGNWFFVLAGSLADEVEPTDDDSDYANWCDDNRPTDAHQEELDMLAHEREPYTGEAVDASITAAADEWANQGGERGIVDADIDAIADTHGVRPSFVASRARALSVPYLG